MTALVNKTSGGTTLTDFGTVKYDGVGDRTAMTATVPGATAYGGTTTDAYDYGQTANPLLNRSQVTSEVTSRNGSSTSTFSYDMGIGTGAGNPTTFPGKTFAYNADNQITSTGYVYDGAGNATTFGTTTVAYDAENRLTGYGSALTAGYTGDNLRAWKQAGSARTYFLYDGGSPVCELSSTGAVTATNTWGRNGLLSRRVGSTSGFYTFDLSGNTAQTLSSTGAVTLTAAVSAFGQRTASGSTTDLYSGLGGQWGCYNDPESGLFLMGHRYYSASAGRFLTRDPMGYAGGINLYAYCGNDPVDESDPDGTHALQQPAESGAEAETEAEAADEAGFWEAAGKVVAPIALPFSIGVGLFFNSQDGLVDDTLDYQRDEASSGEPSCDEGSNGGDDSEPTVTSDPDGTITFTFPPTPEDMDDMLGTVGTRTGNASNKTTWEANNGLRRYRYEEHPLEPGETYNPRHNGPHYHVEERPSTDIGWSNKNVDKLHPDGIL